jgi:hypothetical protein
MYTRGPLGNEEGPAEAGFEADGGSACGEHAGNTAIKLATNTMTER